jgi:hypothetical protein
MNPAQAMAARYFNALEIVFIVLRLGLGLVFSFKLNIVGWFLAQPEPQLLVLADTIATR